MNYTIYIVVNGRVYINMYQELSDELKEKVRKYTQTNYGNLQLNDNAYVLIEDLIDKIEILEEELKEKEEYEI